jgi:molybdate transport system substrate-binding protein
MVTDTAGTAIRASGSTIFGAAVMTLTNVHAHADHVVPQLQVILSGGFAAAYKELAPEFERTFGISVVTTSGSSQGDGPTTIGSQLRSGKAFDAVILNASGLADLMSQRHIVSGSERRLAQGMRLAVAS